MMAGSPVSFNILKGKLMSFLYNIQHAKMLIIIIYADINDFNLLLRFFSFFQNDYDQVQEEAKEG